MSVTPPTQRAFSVSRIGAALALATAAAAAGCGDDAGPRRVPDDGAPCSVMMPAAPRTSEETVRLGSATAIERAWTLRQPDTSVDAPKDFTTYVLRRGSVPPGALAGGALLDAAAERVARGIALQEGTKPEISRVPTPTGEAAEVLWGTRRSRHGTRVLLMPGGYCEVTILGARSDAVIAAYFSSLQLQADGRK